MLLDSLSYPVRQSGWIVLLLGAIFAGLLNLFAHAPLVGFVVAIFSSGYFAAYFLSIVSTTMTGRDMPPDWPGFDSFYDNILSPYFRMIFLTIISFGPPLVLVYFVADATESKGIILAALLAALGWGLLYFPMAMLAMLAFGGVLAASPHIVVPGIVRCLPGYLLTALVFAMAPILPDILGDLLSGIPVLAWIVAIVLNLYGLMVGARLLGLFYRSRQDTLGWE